MDRKKQINQTIEILRGYWLKNPNMQFGEYINTIAEYGGVDVASITDEQLESLAREYHVQAFVDKLIDQIGEINGPYDVLNAVYKKVESVSAARPDLRKLASGVKRIMDTVGKR